MRNQFEMPHSAYHGSQKSGKASQSLPSDGGMYGMSSNSRPSTPNMDSEIGDDNMLEGEIIMEQYEEGEYTQNMLQGGGIPQLPKGFKSVSAFGLATPFGAEEEQKREEDKDGNEL